MNGLDDRPVNAKADIDALRREFSGSLPTNGMPAEKVIEELVASTHDGLLGSASGRFFAWVLGGSTEAALAADWLISTWEQNGALYNCSPAASVIEEVAGDWIKQLFGLPSDASFAFTTGCQLAHFTGLAAARHRQLKNCGWDVEVDGLCGAPSITVFVNPEKHGSVQRAIRYLGIGSKNIVDLPTDKGGTIAINEIEDLLRETSGPKIMVLNAADLNIAACDNFDEIIPIAHAHDVWVHIDGAFGLFANISPKYQHLVKGIELADSWATDAHKWLNVPFDSGMAIIKDSVAHKASMTVSASYIEADSDARDQIDWNPEWSRRARGVPIYAALREMGKNGVIDLVERSCRYCEMIATQIGALDGAVLVHRPTLNQGLVRFERAGAADHENDRFTKKVMDLVNRSGEAFFSDTVWQGRTTMRISVVNWRTNENDIERTVAAVAKVLKEERARP